MTPATRAAMRALVCMLMLCRTVVADDRVQFVARPGVHHTHIYKDDGEPDGWGPKLELEIGWYPFRQIGLAAIATYSYLEDKGLHDGVTNQFYDTAITYIALGARVYLRPDPHVFLGVGTFRQRETDCTCSNEETTHDVIAGVQIPIRDWAIQLAMTGSVYTQYGYEQAESLGVLLGIAY